MCAGEAPVSPAPAGGCTEREGSLRRGTGELPKKDQPGSWGQPCCVGGQTLPSAGSLEKSPPKFSSWTTVARLLGILGWLLLFGELLPSFVRAHRQRSGGSTSFRRTDTAQCSPVAWCASVVGALAAGGNGRSAGRKSGRAQLGWRTGWDVATGG